jgi:glycosyltransferase involved in cell wall biosynthesis
VAGRSGGISDAVRDGETGLLVDSQDSGAVSVAVKELLENPALKRRLGAGGVHAVQTYYNWARVAADLASIGKELGI